MPGYALQLIMGRFLHHIPGRIVYGSLVLILAVIVGGACASSAPRPAAAGGSSGGNTSGGSGGDAWNRGGSSAGKTANKPVPAVVRYGDFFFPSEIAGFRRGKATEFRDKRLGFSVPYYGGGPAMVASFYIYNRGLTRIPEGHTSAVVRRSFISSQEAIQAALERGTYSAARRIHQDIVRLPGQADRKLLRAVYLIRYGSNAGVRESHLMITASRDHLWKIRCTFSADPRTRKIARARVLRLLSELLDYQDRI